MTPYPDTTPAALDLARYDYDCYERATRETAGAYDCGEPFEPYPHDDDDREPGGDALALDEHYELCTPHPDAAERLADCPTYLC